MHHDIRHHPWPFDTDPLKSPATTAIVTVNHNTRDLIVQLIWTIHRALGPDGFARLLVVDNASTDGSREILQALAGERLIEIVANDQNAYHGPGLNRAFDHLARDRGEGGGQIDAVWVLDSDCVVLRPDVLTLATGAMSEKRAAIVGQPVWDEWNGGTFGLHSLLIDPAQVWRDPVVPFAEHGEPSKHLQESAIAEGLTMTPFPFTAERHIIHLGRGTLAQIARTQERDNRYFDWARDHHMPHYAEEAGSERAYAEVHAAFRRDVPTLDVDPHEIARAIRHVAGNVGG
ncbi:MAG TPA: glycosyltransferase [Thermomicrobiales bacterium]|nr:glycosyltransferase [Thermomicrobiales bacterium]